MATFIHKGRSIYFREYGRGEPLLLVHGLGSSGADWGLQLPVLEKRFRVIVPDLPGSGRSQPPREQYSIAGFASALWALLDQLQLDRVNIVGFSMGGAVGFEMSLQRPDGVQRLGLINSLATYKLDHWSKWLEARIPALLVPLIGMERMARLAAGRLFPRPWQRSLRAAAVAVISAVPATSYLGMGLAMLVNVFNLPLYVIGGGVVSGWDLFAPRMFEELRRLSYIYGLTEPGADQSFTTGKTYVVPAATGADAGLLGAAMLPYLEAGTL